MSCLLIEPPSLPVEEDELAGLFPDPRYEAAERRLRASWGADIRKHLYDLFDNPETSRGRKAKNIHVKAEPEVVELRQPKAEVITTKPQITRAPHKKGAGRPAKPSGPRSRFQNAEGRAEYNRRQNERRAARRASRGPKLCGCGKPCEGKSPRCVECNRVHDNEVQRAWYAKAKERGYQRAH